MNQTTMPHKAQTQIIHAIALLLLTLCGATIKASTIQPHDTAPAPQPLRVSLITCAPGREVYQLEGHTALRLTKDSITGNPGYDHVVNWGVFDFASPNFLYRFVKGQTDYMALAYPFDIFMEEYRRDGRRVVEQVLDLTPAQASRVEALAAANILPQNRTYRYNYVKDNCATRPLALIEAALGDTLEFHEPAPAEKAMTPHPLQETHTSATPATFRSEITRYHTCYPWYQFGIDLALGSGIDKPIGPRGQIFAPVFLQRQMATATYSTPQGETRKAVKETRILNHGMPDGVTAEPTPPPFSPIGVSVALFTLTLAISIRDIGRRRITRWFDTILYGTFTFAGTIIAFLIFVSEHEATSPNWLFLWLNPFCLIAAAGIWIKRCKRVVYCYQICNFAALILLLAGHHFFGQALNAAFPLLILCDLMRSFTFIYVNRGSSQANNAESPEATDETDRKQKRRQEK
ncbi:MAG: DUF4105 domain-containing protein [Muribaculaceae bacterium]|nr:DUF4105 domain-containing protein [Muribaculaceae bacterium]